MLKLSLFRDPRFSAAMVGESGILALLGGPVHPDPGPPVRLGYSPLQAGSTDTAYRRGHLPVVPVSPRLARGIGVKATATAGLVAIGGGLGWIAALTTVTTTYGQVVPGMLLIGMGAGLLLPTATNSVPDSVPRGDSGVGFATNTVALQVGERSGSRWSGASCRPTTRGTSRVPGRPSRPG